MRIILAGPDEAELTGAAYPAFAVAGVEVLAAVGAAEKLSDLAPIFPDAVAVVQADLYATPEEAVEALEGLPVRVAVVLPPRWAAAQGKFAALPNLVAGFTAPIPWPVVAAEVKTQAGLGDLPVAPMLPVAPTSQAEAGAQPGVGATCRSSQLDGAPVAPQAALRPTPDPAGGARGGGGRLVAPRGEAPRPRLERLAAWRAVALWSGPAGGVGKTSLALLLAAYAAERGAEPLLLALSEPAVSAYLGLSRVPNVTAFFETGDLSRSVQILRWEEGGRGVLRVALGPARPRDGAVGREQVAALMEAAKGAAPLAVADLPTLPPGGNAWSLEPLLHAGVVILVAAPTPAGVAAAVEALATLRDIRASGQVLLAVNRRTPGGLGLPEFADGVRGLWGGCPPTVEVPYAPGMAAAMDRGELPGMGDMPVAPALAELAEAALGIPRPRPEAEREGTGTGKGDRSVAPARPRRLGRLISVEVVD